MKVHDYKIQCMKAHALSILACESASHIHDHACKHMTCLIRHLKARDIRRGTLMCMNSYCLYVIMHENLMVAHLAHEIGFWAH